MPKQYMPSAYVRPGKLRRCLKCSTTIALPEHAFYVGVRAYCSKECADRCLTAACQNLRAPVYKSRCVSCGIARQRIIAGKKYCRGCQQEIPRGSTPRILCDTCVTQHARQRDAYREDLRKLERKQRTCKNCNCLILENYKHFCAVCQKQRNAVRKRKNAKTQKHKRRLKTGAMYTFSAKIWESVLAQFGNCCAYCLEPCVRLEMDHFEPISNGGSHTVENVVPACRTCNASKGSKPALLWLLQKRVDSNGGAHGIH